MSDSVWPHRQQPTRLLHPWDFPGKNTGVGCHCLLREKSQFPLFLIDWNWEIALNPSWAKWKVIAMTDKTNRRSAPGSGGDQGRWKEALFFPERIGVLWAQKKKRRKSGDFPAGPVVKTELPLQGDTDLIPGTGTKIPYATWLGKKKKREKIFCLCPALCEALVPGGVASIFQPWSNEHRGTMEEQRIRRNRILDDVSKRLQPSSSSYETMKCP